MRLAALLCAAILSFFCAISQAWAQFSTVSNFVGYGGHVVQASDGNFYVEVQNVQYSSTQQAPGIYRVTPSGVASLLVSLPSTITTQVLIQGIDGALYGLYGLSGQPGYFLDQNTVPIVLYKVTLDGKYSTVVTVPANSPDASGPTNMIQDSAGDFYILTSGLDHNNGPAALVKLSMKTLGVTVLHLFENEAPLGPIFQGSDGAIYGVNIPFYYNQNNSTIFRVANDTYQEIDSISSQYATLASPVIEGPDGYLYGFEVTGDSYYLFKVRTDGSGAARIGDAITSPLNYFAVDSNLLFGPDGNIYGIGPEYGLFQTSPSTGETNLFGQIQCINDFAGCVLGNLMQGSDGAFYFPVNGADTSIGVYRFGQGAGTATTQLPPVQISFSPTTVAPGQQSILSWKATEPYSGTAQLCVASGSWSGVVPASGTMKISPPTKGEYTYGINCGETEGNAATLTVTGSRVSTETYFSLASSSAAVGTAVTFTATVKPAAGAGTPTGTVNLSVNGQPFATFALVNGVAQQQINTSTLPAGPDELTATYSGDPNYLSSASSSAGLKLTAMPNITNTSSPVPAYPGQTVTLNITVHAVNGGVTPTGYLTINNTQVSLVNGAAQYTTTAPAASRSEYVGILYAYGGDSNYSSFSNYLEYQEIITPYVYVSVSPSNAVAGQTVTALCQVSGQTYLNPTGTVTFYVNSQPFATVPVAYVVGYDGEVATLTASTAGVPPGTYGLTAVYNGDTNFYPGNSVDTAQLTVTAP